MKKAKILGVGVQADSFKRVNIGILVKAYSLTPVLTDVSKDR